MSILIFILLATFITLEARGLYYHPVYNAYPMTYNYSYNKTFELDVRQNMVSYQLKGPKANLLNTLRVYFMTNNTDSAVVIPAVNCTNYYAREIAAEKNGSSDSNFFTDVYVSPPSSNP